MGSRAVLGSLMRVLGRSWAAPKHLGRLLAGSWAVLGLLGDSLAGTGLLLGVMAGSWTALGLSWATLGRCWAALERSWAPSWSQDGLQDAHRRPQDPPKSKPRRYKTMLTYRSYSELHLGSYRDVILRPSCRKLGAPGAPK